MRAWEEKYAALYATQEESTRLVVFEELVERVTQQDHLLEQIQLDSKRFVDESKFNTQLKTCVRLARFEPLYERVSLCEGKLTSTLIQFERLQNQMEKRLDHFTKTFVTRDKLTKDLDLIKT